MKIQCGDYCLIVDEKNKKQLVLVDSVASGTYNGVVDNADKDNEGTRTTISLDLADVMVNFGTDPQRGTCYGLSVEPFKFTKKINPWGQVQFYRDVSDAEKEVIVTSLRKVGGIIKQRGWMPVKPIDVQVRYAKSKTIAGYYKHASKDDVNDVLTLCPLEFDGETDYYVAHEASHGIWYNMMDKILRGKWIELFAKSTVLSEVTKTDLLSCMDDLKSSGSCKDYMADIKEDETKVLIAKEIFRLILNKHKLTKKDIDVLLENEDTDLKGIWPKRAMELGSKTLLVSDYARKSAIELHAVATAYFILDRELPKDVKALVSETLANI